MRGKLVYELIDCTLNLFARCPVFENGNLARDPELVPGTVSSPSTSTARKYVASLVEEPNGSLMGEFVQSNFKESFASTSCETGIAAV